MKPGKDYFQDFEGGVDGWDEMMENFCSCFEIALGPKSHSFTIFLPTYFC